MNLDGGVVNSTSAYRARLDAVRDIQQLACAWY